jgi:hypothetical protein
MQSSVNLLQIRNYLRLINRVYVIHLNVIDSNKIYIRHHIVIESLSLLMISSFFCKIMHVFFNSACILIASLINRATSRIFFASFWNLLIISFVNIISRIFFSITSIMMTINSHVYWFLSELETVFFVILIVDVKIDTKSIVLRVVFE